MINSINNDILNEFYSNAFSSYLKCIENPDNSFLSDQIGMDISKVQTKYDTISIKFTGINSQNFIAEVRLILLSPAGNELGYYASLSNEKKDEVDDFLVFH